MSTPLPLNVVLLGKSGVGKSSIVGYYGMGSFSEEAKVTLGIDFLAKDVTVKGEAIHLRIWDTAGQEKFKSVVPAYIRACHVAIIVFDASILETFDDANVYFQDVKKARANDAVIAFVANKSDLVTGEQFETARKFAKDNKCLFFLASAKTGDNIKEIFQATAELAVPIAKRVANDSISTVDPTAARSGWCWC
jgi:small GTP-binding protein